MVAASAAVRTVAAAMAGTAAVLAVETGCRGGDDGGGGDHYCGH